MAKMNLKLEIQNSDKVKTLLELLHKHIDDLPEDLVKSLKEVADCDACELGREYICPKLNDGDFKCMADGKEIKHVVTVNKILKRVKVYVSNGADGFVTSGDSIFERELFPSTLKIMSGNETIIEW